MTETNNASSPILKTRIGSVWIGEDGIIRGVITVPNAEQTLDDAIETVNVIKTLCAGKPYPLLSDVRNIQSADRDARNYFAREENAHLILANAVLVGSYVSKMVVNFYLTINKPAFPIRMFTSEAEAIAWLKLFMD